MEREKEGTCQDVEASSTAQEIIAPYDPAEGMAKPRRRTEEWWSVHGTWERGVLIMV